MLVRSLAAALAGAALSVFLPVAEAQAGPAGIWVLDDGSTAVQISRCGDGFCGRIVGVAATARRPMTTPDGERIEVGESRRPLCGALVLEGFRPAGEDRYVDGRVFNPADGRYYRAVATFDSANAVRVRGYVLTEAFGETRRLYRLGSPHGVLRAPDECRRLPELAER